MQPDAFVDLMALCIKQAVAPVLTRLGALEAALERHKVDLLHDMGGAMNDFAEARDTTLALRERVARLEGREPLPGPAGPAGQDGFGFDEFVLQHDGERTFTFRGIKGERVKDFGSFTVAIPLDRGPWQPERTYEKGDGVTYARSWWIAQMTTTARPGDGAAWRVAASRGRDGKDHA